MKRLIEFIKSLFMSNNAPVAPSTPQSENIPTPVPKVAPTPKISTNSTTPSKIDLWCQAAKKMEGALPSRNNPGNIRYIGQKYAVNDRGFCKFDTYEHGYQALKNLFINACTGKSKVYHPVDTLYTFYTKYAPSSDGNNPKVYAEYVAKVIGVSPTIQIKELVA